MANAKFEEVAKQLIERIEDGTYSSAQRLPSEYDLAEEFDVSRLTVRKAIDTLIASKILVKDPGKGTYVMSTGVPNKIESGRMGLQSFTESARAYGKTSQTEVLKFEPLDKPDEEIQKKLKLEKSIHPEVDELVRRRFWDNEPMTIEDIVIPHKYVKGYKKEDFNQSLFEILSKSVEISYSQQEIEAILVDKKMAELLGVEVGQPLMCVKSVTYTADARPIFYDKSYYRADKYTFRTTLTRLEH